MHIVLRPARDDDFAFCWAMYAAEGAWMIHSMNLDLGVQAGKFRDSWKADETRIIASAGKDVGWLQCRMQDGGLYLAQIFVDTTLQNRGIGTQVLKVVLKDAIAAGQAVTLGVVHNNPAVRLYKRLGFYVTGQDEREYRMRREPDVAAPIGNLRA